MQRQARLFRLVRHTDPAGLQATGTLAEGVEWSDGAVALRWRGPWPSTSTWDCIEALLAVHGTGGRTQIHWLPTPPRPTQPPPKPPQHPRDQPITPLWLPAPTPTGLCSHCGHPWPCLACDP
jgi:hypothetical protein